MGSSDHGAFAALQSIKPPSGTELTEQAKRMVAVFDGWVIESQEDFDMVSSEVRNIKRRRAELGAMRRAITDPLGVAVEATNNLFRPADEALDQGEAAGKRLMKAWLDAQEAAQLELQRKAEEQAAQARRDLQERAERAAAEAASAAQAGDAERAAQLAAQAQAAEQEQSMVVAAVAVAPAPKQAGVTVRRSWKAKVVSKAEFLAAVAARPELHALVDVSQSKLNAMARALGQGMSIPGVEIELDQNLAIRT